MGACRVRAIENCNDEVYQDLIDYLRIGDPREFGFQNFAQQQQNQGIAQLNAGERT